MATPADSKAGEVPESQAYKRLKDANPGVYEPKTIYMATRGKGIDWENSLPLKAAMVYHAITGEHVTFKTKSNAKALLVAIAKKCKSLQETSKPEFSDEIVQDGIFLVVGFLSELKKMTENKSREEANSLYLSTHSQEIVKDIIKIENQLPLELIKFIVRNVEQAIKDNEEIRPYLPGKFVGYQLSFNKDDLRSIISRFCWFYSPFHSSRPTQLEEAVLQKKNLLHCLHFSLEGSRIGEEGSGQVWRSPTARQLKRSGVRFEASSKATIDVRFFEPKLQMPALEYDFKLETVVGNLLAWERLSTEEEKPVTRYFQFMNELVSDLGDVRVMKKFGLIKGTWKNLREVLELVKGTDGPASYPSVFMALDKEVRKVWKYHDSRMKKFFVRNRPAVIWVSSVAAASVIATAIYAARRREGGATPS